MTEVAYTEMDADGYITFTTDSFSQFAFIADATSYLWILWVLIALIVLCGVGYYVYSCKKKKQETK